MTDKDRRCSSCYYANTHGSFGNCTNQKAMNHFKTSYIAYKHGDNEEVMMAAKCPYYWVHIHYDIDACHGKNNPTTYIPDKNLDSHLKYLRYERKRSLERVDRCYENACRDYQSKLNQACLSNLHYIGNNSVPSLSSLEYSDDDDLYW